VVAVLFAALTIFVARPDTSPVWNPALFLITGLAIYLSMSSWLKSNDEGKVFGRTIQVVVLIGLALAIFLQAIWIRDQRKRIELLGKEARELKSSQGTTISPSTKSGVSPGETSVQESKKAPPHVSKP
jgi:hypothetical protein